MKYNTNDPQGMALKMLAEYGSMSWDFMIDKLKGYGWRTCVGSVLRLIADGRVAISQEGRLSLPAADDGADGETTEPPPPLLYPGYEMQIRTARTEIKAIREEAVKERCSHVAAMCDYSLSCITNIEEAVKAQREAVSEQREQHEEDRKMAVLEGAASVLKSISESRSDE